MPKSYKKFLSTLSLRRATAPFPRLSSATLFLSTLSLRRATSYQLNCCWSHMDFYPRSPCGERRIIAVGVGVAAAISIHALLAESDTAPTRARRPATAFLSTLSLRRATCRPVEIRPSLVHFYPRSPCGERHMYPIGFSTAIRISIHALLAESDFPQQSSRPRAALFLSTLSLRRATSANNQYICKAGISIHALLAESDIARSASMMSSSPFLSTLSLRRATLPDLRLHSAATHFYPRSPCGERPIALP